jgi:hypothetical protein
VVSAIFAKQPERYAELAGVSVIFAGWFSFVTYVATYGKLDAAVLAIGLVLLVLSA